MRRLAMFLTGLSVLIGACGWWVPNASLYTTTQTVVASDDVVISATQMISYSVDDLGEITFIQKELQADGTYAEVGNGSGCGTKHVLDKQCRTAWGFTVWSDVQPGGNVTASTEGP